MVVWKGEMRFSPYHCKYASKFKNRLHHWHKEIHSGSAAAVYIYMKYSNCEKAFFPPRNIKSHLDYRTCLPNWKLISGWWPFFLHFWGRKISHKIGPPKQTAGIFHYSGLPEKWRRRGGDEYPKGNRFHRISFLHPAKILDIWKISWNWHTARGRFSKLCQFSKNHVPSLLNFGQFQG